ncbi:protein CASPARIAN STRIP INTEGRITY FACTOR 1-like [Typha latifolia]|uniref:protein CASPARIAN STRIP INTEGRITY FACTOR 1-like n=1 Tax=Typha latifolia TaxID=4733 RepID=UPI003C2B3F05
MGPKISTILFALILASLLSTSLAGGQQRFLNKYTVQIEKEEEAKMSLEQEEVVFHARVLKVQTNDYGSSDPPPALAKPPFKLIPN